MAVHNIIKETDKSSQTQAISGDSEIYQKLSVKAMKLLIFYLNDPNLSRAAKKAGVAYKTAQQWMYGRNPKDKVFQRCLKQERDNIKESVQEMLLPLAANYYNMLLSHSLLEKHNNQTVTSSDARIAILYLSQSKYLEINPDAGLDQESINILVNEIVDRNARKHGLM